MKKKNTHKKDTHIQNKSLTTSSVFGTETFPAIGRVSHHQFLLLLLDSFGRLFISFFFFSALGSRLWVCVCVCVCDCSVISFDYETKGQSSIKLLLIWWWLVIDYNQDLARFDNRPFKNVWTPSCATHKNTSLIYYGMQDSNFFLTLLWHCRNKYQ